MIAFFLNSSSTVLEGWAPFWIQALALSASMRSVSPVFAMGFTKPRISRAWPVGMRSFSETTMW
jgi:hypothetical protein